MNRWRHYSSLLALTVVCILTGCQRETPTEKSQPLQPTSAVDHATQQAVDAVNVPMNKARTVEGTLDKAADRQAEMVKDVGQ
jgi:uncharacterized lipoprotein YajG